MTNKSHVQKKQQVNSKLVGIGATYTGPLPLSSELKRYDEISPGSADAIINNFLEESAHRRKLEEREQNLEGNIADRLTKHYARGLWCGFFAVILVLIVGIVFMFKGYPIQGASIIIAVLATLCGCFIYGTRGIIPPKQ